MVMDATPSPQSVGREFVRQYYTLLNKAPDHLHRFYNNHSSFVHGGLEPHNREATLVVGQKQIYNNIQQLNFRDCHAKISQVDAQSTLGSGVVVQVTGELSNDGQPMRRFTQTFVLAAQSPKKYYVHNDIFRYQDLYQDDEQDGESGGRSEADEEIDQQESVPVEASNQQLQQTQQQQQQQQQQVQQIYYPVGVAAPAGQNVGIQAFPQQAQMNGVSHDDLQQQQQQQQAQSIQTPVAQLQQQSQVSMQATELIQEPVDISTGINQTNVDTDLSYNDSNSEQQLEQNIVEPEEHHHHIEPVREEPPIVKNTPAEPKTYANLFKTDVSSGISFASAMANSPALGSTGHGRSSVGTSSYNNNSRSVATDSRQQEPTSAASLPASRSITSRPIKERRSSNANQYGDNHQLFLGNVPHHATEEELTQIFAKFGTVVDLRIHSKSVQKMPGSRAPQNYGFITYDDPEAVQNCLAHMPLFFPENSPDRQQLNVEEKMQRIRTMDSGNGRPGDRGGMNRNNMPGSNGIRLGGSGGSGNNGQNRGPSSGGSMRTGGPMGGSGGSRGGPPSGRGGGSFNRTDNRGSSSGGGGSAPRGGNVGGGGQAPSGGNSNYNRR